MTLVIYGGLVSTAVRLHRLSAAYLRGYHRHVVHRCGSLPDEPALIVGNHGFGTLTDLNVMATFAALDACGVDRPTTTLVHQMAWTLGLGRLLEALDCRKASASALEEAITEGRHVVLFPGGDVEAAKSFRDRDLVTFAGRSGFARLATDLDVPVVPVVTVGAGESLFVLTDGKALAALLRLDRLLRYKVFPVSVSIPWGLSFGLTGLLPYLPLPTKLETTVLAPMRARDGETPSVFAARVEGAMQRAADRMTADRHLLLGHGEGSPVPEL